mgnify:CR=1 FL=1
MSTAHPPTAQAPMRTVLSHVIVPILMGLIMCAAYLGGFHKPSPHHVPVAVVGQAQQAGPLAAKVQDAFGDEADVRTIATPEQATDQLKHLKISAAYVPGDGKAELLTAGGASDTTKSVVEKMFRPVAEKQHDALTVKDVAPLTEDDPAGQNGFFFLVALTVAAYATSIAIGAAAASRPFAQRIALAAGADDTVYAIATDVSDVIRSDDAGLTWEPTGADLVAASLAVDGRGRVIAATEEGVQISTDGGASFAAWPEAPLLYTLGAAADRTQVVGVGTDGQIWVTGAGAASWEPAGRVDGRVQAVGMDAAGRIVIVDETSGITILPG